MIKKIWILFPLMAAMIGCSNFLKEEDSDLLIPRTAEHYLAILHRQAFFENHQNRYTEFMTDDIDENPRISSNAKNTYKSLYTWQADIEIDGNGLTSDVNSSWTRLYRMILTANYILENIGKAEGQEAMKGAIRGESHFLIAKCYFELVNLYAPHYEQGNAANQLGVARREGTGIQETYVRTSVEEIYGLIIDHLKRSVAEFEAADFKQSLWHPNQLTARLLLSRVYLYKGDYENCIVEATNVITGSGGMLWNLNEQSGTVVNNINPEILHTYGDNSSLINNQSADPTPLIYSSGGDLAYRVSTSLENCFLPGDLRNGVYIAPVTGGAVPTKWAPSFTSLGAFSFRVVEAYLNRAEAYAFTNQEALAVADLKYVLRNRVSDLDAITIPAAGDELKQFIFDERRREFCFEGMRLFDLKRMKGFTRQIDHLFTLRSTTGSLSGTELYMLPANDPNYVWPIPKEEINSNSQMVQNPRQEKVPIVDEN